MHRLLILLFIFTLFVSCQRNIDCGINPMVIKANDSIISRVQSDTSGQKWWNNYLTKIKEPILTTELNESYRLMIYNSMWESSITYRIYKKSDSYKLVFKEFGGEQIERQDARLTSSLEIDLSKKEWTEFQDLLDNTGFWSLPVTIERSGLDGTSWVLEGKNPNGNDCTDREYHVVSRWQPLDSMKVMKLNYKLIELKKE